MDHPKIKERAYSLATYLDMKKSRPLEFSPEMRPKDTTDEPPLISLSPSVLDNSLKIKQLLSEKEQDQYLIKMLKKHCFEQSKEIERLKKRLESLQHNYENLLVLDQPISSSHQGIMEVALLARSRSESLNV